MTTLYKLEWKLHQEKETLSRNVVRNLYLMINNDDSLIWNLPNHNNSKTLDITAAEVLSNENNTTDKRLDFFYDTLISSTT